MSCDGCGVRLVWSGTDWLHAEPTRCDHFDAAPAVRVSPKPHDESEQRP